MKDHGMLLSIVREREAVAGLPDPVEKQHILAGITGGSF
jgi:hypothetical protein